MKLGTVIVTRYAESDQIVFKCLESLKRQNIPIHVLFLDQQQSERVKQFTEVTDDSKVSIEYETIPAKSLSYARNHGLRKARTQYVLFCDVDCILDNQWAKAIVEAFESTGATIIGTRILPDWEITPRWYMETIYLREFFSLLDLGEGIIPVTKVVGASFAIDKARITDHIVFAENLGRQNGRLLCGEETDLCIQVLRSGGKIYYTSDAIAHHQIQKERIAFTWLQRRAYFGGFSRAVRGGKIDPFSKKVRFIDKIGILPFVPAYFVGRVHGLWSQCSISKRF